MRIVERDLLEQHENAKLHQSSRQRRDFSVELAASFQHQMVNKQAEDGRDYQHVERDNFDRTPELFHV